VLFENSRRPYMVRFGGVGLCRAARQTLAKALPSCPFGQNTFTKGLRARRRAAVVGSLVGWAASSSASVREVG
jgi:hypothetical protein